MRRDSNNQPYFGLDSFDIVKAEPSDFAGGTDNARGDKDGTSAALTLYTVTGDVLVQIWGVCTTVIAGASAKLEVGVANNTAVLIAQTTATDIDAEEIWLGAAPSAVSVDQLSDVTSTLIIANGADIIETTSTQDITSGQIYYVCMWRPLSQGSSVVAA